MLRYGLKATVDFNFTLAIPEYCEMTNITDIELYCKNAEAADYSFCTKVVINSIVFFLPDLKETIVDGVV